VVAWSLFDGIKEEKEVARAHDIDRKGTPEACVWVEEARFDSG